MILVLENGVAGHRWVCLTVRTKSDDPSPGEFSSLCANSVGRIRHPDKGAKTIIPALFGERGLEFIARDDSNRRLVSNCD